MLLFLFLICYRKKRTMLVCPSSTVSWLEPLLSMNESRNAFGLSSNKAANSLFCQLIRVTCERVLFCKIAVLLISYFMRNIHQGKTQEKSVPGYDKGCGKINHLDLLHSYLETAVLTHIYVTIFKDPKSIWYWLTVSKDK